MSVRLRRGDQAARGNLISANQTKTRVVLDLDLRARTAYVVS
jgi:hypothetical protein